MKLFISINFCLISVITADMTNILKQMGEMVKSENLTVGGMNLRNANLDDDRMFVNPILQYMAPILNYGCWCHFGQDWIHAGGKVRDDIDLRCKQLIQGYRCARMDNNGCDAGNVNYTPYNFFFGQDIHDDCQSSNAGDQCAIDACVIEGSFTMHFLNDFVSGNIANLADPKFQGSNGWDREAECAPGTKGLKIWKNR